MPILLMKKTIYTLLTLTLIISLLPTQVSKTGGNLPLGENLNILVIRDGVFNPLLNLVEISGIKLPGDNSTDRYLQNLNAFGLATHYFKGSTPEGLYLSEKKGSPDSNPILHTGDVISHFTFNPKCTKTQPTLQASWVRTHHCASTVTIFRDQKFLKLHLPATASDNFNALRVISDQAPPSPKTLNLYTGLSAGLILSLYYLDLSSKGSLFSNDKVAGSGMIEPGSYSYSAISELPKKYQAAVNSKSTILFLAHNQDLGELYNSKIKLTPNLKIYKIKSLKEAVAILCARGANDALCQRKI